MRNHDLVAVSVRAAPIVAAVSLFIMVAQWHANCDSMTEITLAAKDVAFIRRDGRVLVSPVAGQGVFFGFEE